MAAAGVVSAEIPKSVEGRDDLLLSRYRMLDSWMIEAKMHAVNALAVARMLMGSGGTVIVLAAEDISFGSLWWVEAIGQIEELLSEVRVIEFKGNHIRLLLKTPIPSMDILPLQYNSASFIEPAVVDHELMIEILENNLEPMNLEIFPADVYVDEIIRNAKSSRKKENKDDKEKQKFYAVGGKDKGSFLENFSKEVIETSFNVNSDEVLGLFEQESRELMVKATEEQISTISKAL
ncbi:hypothetical protein J5N97_023198 [Dioscorea zingiberensis]|uniref:Uncharacterized protein n=1 Tax=Dioscorea zingiberensis TaxID=325984 RepID=A0A9D5HBA4_9LILI|nr:hypothetical protein J5N97_023198 [Dioscorea zingiberensis]